MQQINPTVSEMLSRLRIDTLNDMQQAAMAAIGQHQNVLLLSSTGSGKTLAYLLPLVPLLDKKPGVTQAMIIVPSRELAQQIGQVFRSMQTGLKATLCYGGHLRETEENDLLEAPALIIGTPGRIADHLRRNNIKTPDITTLVLDEFDKSLELGFEEEISFIVSSLTHVNRRILVSATKAVDIPAYLQFTEFATLDYLAETQREALALQLVKSADKDKLDALFSFICLVGNRSIIIFCNHRDAVERVSEFLSEKGIVNVFYHGALDQQERDSALCKFRNGTSSVLVTTDLASRGLDIPNIRYIVHYHLPATQEVFTHRNGRTARMEASGTAVVILGPDEQLPSFIDEEIEEVALPEKNVLPDKPKWSTLFIAAGKKDKVNKVDIVGFFTNKGRLKKDDLGLIEVKDFFSFAAVRKSTVSMVLQNIKNEKIKNKKVRIDIAK